MARKLTKKDLDEYRMLLLQRRMFLTGNMGNLENGVGGNGAGRDSMGDAADLGAGSLEMDFALSVLESEGNALQMIDEAITRVDSGSYGICDNCEKPIIKARLKAIPWADRCIDCQRAEEGAA